MTLSRAKNRSMTRQVAYMFSSLFLVMGLAFLIPVLGIIRSISVERLADSLLHIVSTAALQVEGDCLTRFSDNGAVSDQDWQAQRVFLEKVREANDLEPEHVYIFRLTAPLEWRELQFVIMLHPQPFVGDIYQVPEETAPLVRKAVTMGKPQATNVYQDNNGTWISAFAPIQNIGGQVVGLLQADYRVDTKNQAYWRAFKEHSLPILLIFAVLLIPGIYLVTLVTRGAVRPIHEMADLAEQISRGQWELPLPELKWAELTRLGVSFEAMREKVKAQLVALKDFNRELENQVTLKTRDLRETNEALIKAKSELEEQAAAIIEFQKTHDPLTHLGNRGWFVEKLTVAVARAAEEGDKVGVLILGMDRFNRINESAGTQEGDRVLRKMAARLLTSVKAGDVVARVDGDGFGLILTGFGEHEELGKIAQRLLDRVAEPIEMQDLEVRLSASVGISVFPMDCTDVENLLRDAGTAMKVVKKEGGNRYRFYTQSMDEQTLRRLSLENSLRKALDNGEFELFYQPQVHVGTGKIVGVESLVRWEHPERGLVSPGEFIPLAEETGLIVPLGKWIIEEACRARKRWSDDGLPEFLVAINLSARQFEQKDLVPFVGRAIERAGVPPELIELEVTESIAMRDVRATINTLSTFKDMRIALAIDDFGTGYSSFSYLKQFAIDKLKVDRSFIIDFTREKEDQAIVDAIVRMGHALGLTVIAEGVEDAEQLALLGQLKCDEYQGFYFSKPVPEPALVKLVHSYQSSV